MERPKPLHIKIDEHEVDVPQTWNQLPLRTALMVYNILITDTGGLLEPHELLPGKKIMLACALLDITPDFLEKWRSDCIAELESEEDGELLYLAQLDEVLICANFLFDKLESDDGDGATKYQISLGLTKCPWPILKRKSKLVGRKPKTYYAPADGLANLTIYEMAAAFTAFEQYLRTKNESHANRLLAILYRPAKARTRENIQSGFEGDIRLPYLHHESTVQARQEWVATLPADARQLLVFWFASCRQAIIEGYPNVFSGSGEGSDGRKYGWSGVLLSLADGLVHLDAVANQNHQNALTYLSYLDDQRRKRKLQSL